MNLLLFNAVYMLIPLGGLACFLAVKSLRRCGITIKSVDYADCLATFFVGLIAGIALGFLPLPVRWISIVVQASIYALCFRVEYWNYWKGLVIWLLTHIYLILMVALITFVLAALGLY